MLLFNDQDAQFGDDSCLYFLYPIKGGTFHSVSKKIGKHVQSPVPSSDRVCIRSCGFGEWSAMLHFNLFRFFFSF